MLNMFLGFSYFIWILTIIIIVFILAFLLYKQIIGINLLFLNVLFIISTIVALIALFIPGIFNTIANNVVENTSFAVTLKNFDNSITNISKVPNQVVDDIRNIFKQNSNQTQNQSFQSNLYPTFLSFIGGAFRWVSFILAVIIMTFTIYLKYAFSSTYQAKELQKEIDDLQKRLKMVESR